MPTAYGHSLAEALYEPLPEGLFDYKLDWDPTLIMFAIMLIFYRRGLKAFRGRIPISNAQKISFYTGITVSIIALSPPIDPLSDRLFFMHMIQHMLIVNVGVPLMLMGVPFYIIVRGLSPRFRRGVYFPLVKSRVLRLLHKVLMHPLIALALFEINFWMRNKCHDS